MIVYSKESYHHSSPDFKSVYSAADLAHLVQDSVEYYENTMKEATSRANRTKEEVAAALYNEFEEENKQLKERLKLSYGSFNSEKELHRFQFFAKEHAPCRNISKINSGRACYVIPTYTGVGIAYEAYCPICHCKEDITDMDVW